jgi:hypothetical protein
MTPQKNLTTTMPKVSAITEIEILENMVGHLSQN